MQVETLLRQGNLSECKARLFSQIKHSPADPALRVFLFQLACVEQDWKRALSQLEVLRSLSEANLPLVNTYSSLIEHEQKKQQVLSGESPCPCFGLRPDWMQHFYSALTLHHQGKVDEAKAAALKGAETAPLLSGSVDGNRFEWLTDGDMRFGPLFEIIISSGYFHLPYNEVKRIDFEAVEDLRDIVWRPATVTLKNNAQFIVFFVVRYPATAATTAPQKLARECVWLTPVTDFYTGQGQRVLISDKDEFPLLNIQSVEFD